MNSKRPEPWTVLSSKHVVKDKWLSLRIDDCRTEDGVEINPYYVIECPDWALIAAFDDEMRLLIVEQYRHGLGEVICELPGGIVDAGDMSPMLSVQRELLEETGCEVAEVHHLTSMSPNPATHTNKAHMYTGTGCREVASQNLDEVERIEHRFVSVGEVLELISTGQFHQPNHICCVFLALKEHGLLTIGAS